VTRWTSVKAYGATFAKVNPPCRAYDVSALVIDGLFYRGAVDAKSHALDHAAAKAPRH